MIILSLKYNIIGLMLIKPIKTRIFKENENLLEFLDKYISKPSEGSIVVVTSKIVALSEGRTHVKQGQKTKEKLIRQESQYAMRTRYTWLTIKDNMLIKSAGIDESNADGKYILLPANSFKSANQIRKYFVKKYSLKKFGVLITDSLMYPLRNGAVGIALGYSGFSGIIDYRGQKDLFGRRLKSARTDAADTLASVSVLLMGEGNQSQPLAMITDVPVKFQNRIDKNELRIDIRDDIYQPIMEKIRRIKF